MIAANYMIISLLATWIKMLVSGSWPLGKTPYQTFRKRLALDLQSR
jgi:hypothetical protein